MTNNDLVGLIVSYLYASGLLVLGEALRRIAGVTPNITRKIVHIGAGMWALGVMALFDTWYWGVLPFATFIVLNAIIYRWRLIKALDDDSRSPGTIYFAIAVSLLFAFFWRPQGPSDLGPLALAGVMAMTWGDALAALVGRAYGKRRYQVGNSVRSYVGSAVMFVVSALVVWLTLTLVPGSTLAPVAPVLPAAFALIAALAAASIATVAEAVAPRGLDNLLVPVAVTLVLWFVLG